jgi:hypothetical protein
VGGGRQAVCRRRHDDDRRRNVRCDDRQSAGDRAVPECGALQPGDRRDVDAQLEPGAERARSLLRRVRQVRPRHVQPAGRHAGGDHVPRGRGARELRRADADAGPRLAVAVRVSHRADDRAESGCGGRARAAARGRIQQRGGIGSARAARHDGGAAARAVALRDRASRRRLHRHRALCRTGHTRERAGAASSHGSCH